jgi:hypothetical protein
LCLYKKKRVLPLTSGYSIDLYKQSHLFCTSTLTTVDGMTVALNLTQESLGYSALSFLG